MGRLLDMYQSHSTVSKRFFLSSILVCSLILTSILSGCDSGDGKQQTLTTGNQTITYNTRPQDVVIRTFYGGGLYGSFSLGPQVSIYGDGSYILGLDKQGKLPPDGLNQLLSTLTNTYGLLSFKRQHSVDVPDQQRFMDMPDQNATYLELYLNGKRYELVYGPFGNQQQSQQDLDEYTRLGEAITAINNAITGSTHPYTTTSSAILVRQNFNPGDQQLLTLALPNYSLAEAATYVCGEIEIPEKPDPNLENGCLKYTVPLNALLPTAEQLQAFKTALGTSSQGTFQEGTNYYTVVIRPLLPDEQATKKLAMLGSSQNTFKEIPTHEGSPPPPKKKS